MTTKKTNNYPHNEVLELYEKLIAELPGVERKGKTMPYTSVNGNMFSFLDKEGRMSLRLPVDVRNELIEKYKTELSVQHGRLMKEYVLIPEPLLADSEKLVHYFESGHQYTSALKPK